MTLHTDTLTIPTEAPGETTAPPEVDPPTTGRRPILGWVAVGLAGLAVAGLAFVTFSGGGESDIPPQGFYPEAEAIEREAHLEGQARTHLGDQGTPPATDAPEGPADSGFLPGSRHVPTS